MELQHKHTDEKENPFELADRKALFQLSYFLERQSPQSCAIHMFVNAALIVNDPLYRVYFRRAANVRTSTGLQEDEFSLIIGVRIAPLVGSGQRATQKCWMFTTWTSDEEEIPKVFSAINDVDWLNDAFFIYCQTSTPHPAIDSFLNSNRGLGRDEWPYYSSNRFVFPMKDALNLQISCPDNVYVKSLERRDAQTAYENWTYKNMSSVENFALGIDQLPSAGVFLKDTDQLVTWMMCNPPFGMSRLYTLENHRRKGYAKLAVQYLSKRMAQAGLPLFVHIVIENESSYNLFQSLGFKMVCSCSEYRIYPNHSLSQ